MLDALLLEDSGDVGVGVGLNSVGGYHPAAGLFDYLRLSANDVFIVDVEGSAVLLDQLEGPCGADDVVGSESV